MSSSTPRLAHPCGWSDGDPRWDDEAATVAYLPPGGRRQATVTAPPPSRRRRLLLRRAAGTVAVIGVAVVVGAGVAASGLVGPGRERPPRPEATSAPTTTPACGPAPTPATGRTDVLRYEVEHDGCRESVLFDPATGVLERPGGSFLVGAPGDWLGVGDFDCDGVATPVIYRAATGEVFHFDGWPEERALESRPPERHRPDGVAAVRPDGDCDRLEILGR